MDICKYALTRLQPFIFDNGSQISLLSSVRSEVQDYFSQETLRSFADPSTPPQLLNPLSYCISSVIKLNLQKGFSFFYINRFIAKIDNTKFANIMQTVVEWTNSEGPVRTYAMSALSLVISEIPAAFQGKISNLMPIILNNLTPDLPFSVNQAALRLAVTLLQYLAKKPTSVSRVQVINTHIDSVSTLVYFTLFFLSFLLSATRFSAGPLVLVPSQIHQLL